jgi:hypothetical protein
MKNNIIVFNTLSQAKNYLNRTKAYFRDEGCGCCSYGSSYFLDTKTKLVLRKVYSCSMGSIDYDVTVVGRVKKIKGVST